MSKIIVDEMPKEPSDCPFARENNWWPDTQFYNAHYDYVCCVDTRICTNPGSHCDYLKELPKGDKENGSSQD